MNLRDTVYIYIYISNSYFKSPNIYPPKEHIHTLLNEQIHFPSGTSYDSSIEFQLQIASLNTDRAWIVICVQSRERQVQSIVVVQIVSRPGCTVLKTKSQRKCQDCKWIATKSKGHVGPRRVYDLCLVISPWLALFHQQPTNSSDYIASCCNPHMFVDRSPVNAHISIELKVLKGLNCHSECCLVIASGGRPYSSLSHHNLMNDFSSYFETLSSSFTDGFCVHTSVYIYYRKGVRLPFSF